MMPGISLLANWYHQLAEVATSGGFVAALATVCLLQYIVHVYVNMKRRREYKNLQRELAGLEAELIHVSSDRKLKELENTILREFVAEREICIALKRLLLHFIPHGNNGLAAFVEVGHNTKVIQSVGMTEKSYQTLVVDKLCLDLLVDQPVIHYTGQDLKELDLYRSLSEEDQKQVHELFLIRTGMSPFPTTILITTDLFPLVQDPHHRRELAARVLSGVGNHIRQTATHSAQEEELRITRDILELRSITDLEFRSPQEMLKEFLEKLVCVTGYHQASLFLAPAGPGSVQLLLRHGLPLSEEEAEQWADTEDDLIRQSLPMQTIQHWTPDSMPESLLFHDLPFQDAVTAPMMHDGLLMGVLCLSRVGQAPLAESEKELISWAADYLIDTLLRTADRVQIEDQARRDSLTGLANRRVFDMAILEYVQHSLRTGRECSLVLFDIDHFKSVNDQYGHLAGDEALVSVSRQVKTHADAHMRESDHPIVARYGGEELALILPGVGTGGAIRIADEIRRAVERQAIHFEGNRFSVTISGGIAVAPRHGRTVRQIIAEADRALYRAKQNGRNRIESASQEDSSPKALQESLVS